MSRAQDRINAYWSRWAPDYEAHQHHRAGLPGEREAWEAVWTSALPAAPADVLDVGTGSGHAALTIAGLGHRVTGIDLAAGMLEQARARPESHLVDFRLGDAAEPPGEEASLDAITARYLLWTLRDPVAALRRWRRLLRPGGVIVIVDALWFPGGLARSSAQNAGQGERPAHFRDAYRQTGSELPLAEAESIEAFAAVIAEAGFEEVRIDPLPEIAELDLAHGVAPGHRPEPQHRITARAPRDLVAAGVRKPREQLVSAPRS